MDKDGKELSVEIMYEIKSLLPKVAELRKHDADWIVCHQIEMMMIDIIRKLHQQRNK